MIRLVAAFGGARYALVRTHVQHRLDALLGEVVRRRYPPMLRAIMDDMAWRFWTDTTGLIWADSGDEREGFNQALNDTINALSPREKDPSLSTYWIDHALDNLRRSDSEDDVEVSTGNATCIFRSGARVCAASLYDTFDPEWMELSEFAQGLEDWRAEVFQAINSGATVRSDQSHYQRNPWPN